MLITRCPNCRTSFKVVPDQLRLGQGWVKCGKCALAFNAEKNFVTLPAQGQALAAPAAAATVSTVATAAMVATSATFIQPQAQHENIAPANQAKPDEQASHSKPQAPVDDEDAYDDDKLSPQTLFPSDALDAIDELVAMGAMRAAGTPSTLPPSSDQDDTSASSTASRPGFMQSHAVPSASFPEDSVQTSDEASKPEAADASAVDSIASPGLLTNLLTNVNPQAQPAPAMESQAGSLDAWRKRKAERKHKRPQARLSTISADISSQATVPPWHPQAQVSEETIEGAVNAEPSFVAQAKSRERWQSLPARLLLWALLSVGSFAAVAQLAYLNRHSLAVSQPGSLPFLNTVCDMVNSLLDKPCDIEPLKRIEALRVDSHSLAPDTAADAAPNSYVLSVTLKNQLDLANSWPALDIAFTDTTGAVQARRVLQARDYLDAAGIARLEQGLSAREEQRVSVRFEAPTLRVGGYEITAFYP